MLTVRSMIVAGLAMAGSGMAIRVSTGKGDQKPEIAPSAKGDDVEAIDTDDIVPEVKGELAEGAHLIEEFAQQAIVSMVQAEQQYQQAVHEAEKEEIREGVQQFNAEKAELVQENLEKGMSQNDAEEGAVKQMEVEASAEEKQIQEIEQQLEEKEHKLAEETSEELKEMTQEIAKVVPEGAEFIETLSEAMNPENMKKMVDQSEDDEAFKAIKEDLKNAEEAESKRVEQIINDEFIKSEMEKQHVAKEVAAEHAKKNTSAFLGKRRREGQMELLAFREGLVERTERLVRENKRFRGSSKKGQQEQQPGQGKGPQDENKPGSGTDAKLDMPAVPVPVEA